jgi:hypothetical protein
MGETPIQPENTTQFVGLKISLSGAALMLIGAAIGSQIQIESSANMMVSAKDAREIVALVPSIVGSLMTFVGSIRMSLTVRPLRLAALGFVLVVVASALPLAVAQVVPEMNTYKWTLPSVLPVFVLRIVGLIFFSTAVLRLLLGARDKT